MEESLSVNIPVSKGLEVESGGGGTSGTIMEVAVVDDWVKLDVEELGGTGNRDVTAD